jgi:hypothetical protein
VIIHAEKHYGQVIDWTCSGKPIPYLAHPDFLAPDAIRIHHCGPSEDVYAAARCLIFLAMKSEYLLDLEEPFVEFLNLCIQPRRRYRPANAVVAAQQFREVQKQVFGERKFVELTMP